LHAIDPFILWIPDIVRRIIGMVYTAESRGTSFGRRRLLVLLWLLLGWRLRLRTLGLWRWLICMLTEWGGSVGGDGRGRRGWVGGIGGCGCGAGALSRTFWSFLGGFSF
jgi:hypothetical protein